jgi:hypothetical protein
VEESWRELVTSRPPSKGIASFSKQKGNGERSMEDHEKQKYGEMPRVS